MIISTLQPFPILCQEAAGAPKIKTFILSLIDVVTFSPFSPLVHKPQTNKKPQLYDYNIICIYLFCCTFIIPVLLHHVSPSVDPVFDILRGERIRLNIVGGTLI